MKWSLWNKEKKVICERYPFFKSLAAKTSPGACLLARGARTQARVVVKVFRSAVCYIHVFLILQSADGNPGFRSYCGWCDVHLNSVARVSRPRCVYLIDNREHVVEVRLIANCRQGRQPVGDLSHFRQL